ncbi:MAG TPA: hypothetical protein VIV11_33805 [Kofleriaceae bacterium]
MTPELLAETKSELGLADATPLVTLPTEQLAWLRDAARTARDREQAALEAAVDRALDHVPWLLRGAVKRILFP